MPEFVFLDGVSAPYINDASATLPSSESGYYYTVYGLSSSASVVRIERHERECIVVSGSATSWPHGLTGWSHIPPNVSLPWQSQGYYVIQENPVNKYMCIR